MSDVQQKRARNDVTDIVQLALTKERALLRAKLEAEYLAAIPRLRALRSPSPDVVAGRNGQPLVVERVRGRGRFGRVYSHLSCCWLRPSDEPRRWAILLVESRWMDPIVLMIILLNCFTLAWESPLDLPGTWKAMLIEELEWVFLWIFTLEMLLKMLAFGVWSSKNSYLVCSTAYILFPATSARRFSPFHLGLYVCALTSRVRVRVCVRACVRARACVALPA